MTIYDSMGKPHEATVTFAPTAVANTWSYSVALPASDFSSGTSTPVTGTLGFDSTGALTTLTPAGGAAETVGTGAGDVSSIPLGFTGLTDHCQRSEHELESARFERYADHHANGYLRGLGGLRFVAGWLLKRAV